MQVAKDKVVTVDYTLTGSDGAVLDTSSGHEPLTYLHGVGGIVPGLEHAMEGKNQGDTVDVTVPPEEAYGQRNESFVQQVPKSAFGGAKVEQGMQFRAQSPDGASRIVTVVGVDDDKVRVDANHPLAGKTLHFNVKVLGVRDATQEEIDHRHAHGAGGHNH
ncbi:MAG: Peptidylprolyl isomerase, FKBP-type [Phycisphaerales bacterium]|jgi:FKBP-type peptidyl-prolyl cis-trans isomerase SlyD|nr:Peptidylprolyl isomerase, FKBP-type [Phycisphaerales bacterium]MDB5353617.1 Peptidylprolyl isomerase, FKBP-type [Phycisphaerales bacterium]